MSLPSVRSQVASLAEISVRFSVVDLVLATDNFHPDRQLGSGTFGTVYHGRLQSGTTAAVKVLPNAAQFSGFEDEVRVLSRLRHPNLVTLLGWGMDDSAETCFLVYELLIGGDLGTRLCKSKCGEQEFSWTSRLLVAIDAGRGLSYMVNSQPKVFHRDIKPPNILLDSSGNAKIADFGLARVARDIWQSHLSIQDGSGTPGYMSPELSDTGEVTEQSEVYSFGVVVLELLTNELPESVATDGAIAHPIKEIVDPCEFGARQRVLGNLDPSGAWPTPITAQVAGLALRCVQRAFFRRPSFSSIVTDLTSIREKALRAGGKRGASVGVLLTTDVGNNDFDQCRHPEQDAVWERKVCNAPPRTCPAFSAEDTQVDHKCAADVGKLSIPVSQVHSAAAQKVFEMRRVSNRSIVDPGKTYGASDLPDARRLQAAFHVCNLVNELGGGSLESTRVESIIQDRLDNESKVPDGSRLQGSMRVSYSVRERGAGSIDNGGIESIIQQGVGKLESWVSDRIALFVLGERLGVNAGSKSTIDADRLNAALTASDLVCELADGAESIEFMLGAPTFSRSL